VVSYGNPHRTSERRRHPQLHRAGARQTVPPGEQDVPRARARKPQEARKGAERWAEELEALYQQQRASGNVHQDLGSLKVPDLIEHYLADPATRALGTYSERVRQMAWWNEQCGSRRALEFTSPLVLREAREALLAKHEAGAPILHKVLLF
jgi:hypothetical protein